MRTIVGGRLRLLCAVPIIQPPFLQPYIKPPCATATVANEYLTLLGAC